MFLVLQKTGTSLEYNLCFRFHTYNEAQAVYNKLLQNTPPSKLLLTSTTEARLRMIVTDSGEVQLSPEDYGDLPIATQEQMGIIRLATALQADYDNPQDYIDGMPVSVSPSLIKLMIDRGILESGVGFPDATTEFPGKVRLATNEEANYDNPSNGNDGLAVMQPVVTKGMITTASQYSTEYAQDVTNVKEALDDIYEQLNYVDLKIESFEANNTLFEFGSNNTVTFTWRYNKDIVSQTFNGETILKSLRQSVIQNVNSSRTVILTATDSEKTLSKTVTLTFTHKIYWGVGNIPENYTSNWIKNLNDNKLSTTYKGTYHFDTGSNKYAFIAVPNSYNIPLSAYINSWLTDLADCGIVSYTSDYGITSEYRVLRTTNSGLGSFDLEYL